MYFVHLEHYQLINCMSLDPFRFDSEFCIIQLCYTLNVAFITYIKIEEYKSLSARLFKLLSL